MGWFSRIRSPLLARASIAIWRLFTDLDLSDARQQRFESLHACFARKLVAGARPIDPDPQALVSPCDGIVGACGPVAGTTLWQAKGFPYAMQDLFGPTQDTTAFHDGLYITIRLTSSMYHRFHAPQDCRIEHLTYLSGDTWNIQSGGAGAGQASVLPQRARGAARPARRGGHPIAIVPVAAILVASIRLHFLDVLLHLKYPGSNEIACDARFAKGQEIGWFQHGSTLILFAPGVLRSPTASPVGPACASASR